MRVLVAMSGGVDSSVAARLLCERGYECIGCTMRLYDNEEAGLSVGHTCCTLDDAEDARSVAAGLGMRFYVFNFCEDFRRAVIDRFIDGYAAGLTPNPCIDCNRYIKFERLYDRAELMGCDYIATGHYARIVREGERYLLKRALDPTKDQSYVLYSMTQRQLSHTLFPLGEIKKTEVRGLAAASGFINADKPDSQDICFVPDGDYAAAIERLSGRCFPPGNFVDREGRILGRHAGIIRYTVGQHKGLGVSLGSKRYVCLIRPESGDIVLGDREELGRRELTVSDFNWISGEAPIGEIRCSVMTRYRRAEQTATAYMDCDGRVRIAFDEPCYLASPGQAAVLYDGDVVLGGGRIESFS